MHVGYRRSEFLVKSSLIVIECKVYKLIKAANLFEGNL